MRFWLSLQVVWRAQVCWWVDHVSRDVSWRSASSHVALSLLYDVTAINSSFSWETFHDRESNLTERSLYVLASCCDSPISARGVFGAATCAQIVIRRGGLPRAVVPRLDVERGGNSSNQRLGRVAQEHREAVAKTSAASRRLSLPLQRSTSKPAEIL